MHGPGARRGAAATRSRRARFRLAGLGLAVLALGRGGALVQAEAPSRDVRSASYCSVQANQAGFFDTESALACRREEYTAAARARGMTIPAEIDAYCESLAGEGDPTGPFSWRAFVDCVDGLQP